MSMARRPLADKTLRRLRLILVLFFLALAIPTGLLLKQSYSQLKWEAFHQHRVLAEELVARIDQRYSELIAREDARAFTDYAFLNVTGDARANLLQRSPLAAFPVASNIPGALGYFQIDHSGRFTTPLLPEYEASTARYGIGTAELSQRRDLRDHIYKVLSDNRLVQKPVRRQLARPAPSAPAPEVDAARPRLGLSSSAPSSIASAPAPMEEAVTPQSAFDQLQESKPEAYSKTPRVADLKLEKKYEDRLAQALVQTQRKDATREREVGRSEETQKLKRSLRKEQSLLPEKPAGRITASQPARISTFESEVDALEFSVLDDGHFVLYRKVWRNGQRYIQGLLIDSQQFINGVIQADFYQAAVSQGSSLAIAYQGGVIATLASHNSPRYLNSSDDLQGTLLLLSRLAEPLSRMELIFSVSSLPAGPGGSVLMWTALVLLMVLTGGFYLLYRLGAKQITLARQQQDFVSAVSHELKTPLTSIRMYGEMLREGWASEDKRLSYYDYIYEESERLTRLINNVLQLARMSRHDLHVELKPYSVAQLLDTLRSKVSSQVERAGFTLNINCDEAIKQKQIEVDADYFTQVIINLVDNALKFSAKAERRQIDIHCQALRDGSLQISLRDYGPGIPKEQLRKVFRLFYRLENELTRETVGTGIGLALVRELLTAMHGSIDVVNQTPGVEFRLGFSLV